MKEENRLYNFLFYVINFWWVIPLLIIANHKREQEYVLEQKSVGDQK